MSCKQQPWKDGDIRENEPGEGKGMHRPRAHWTGSGATAASGLTKITPTIRVSHGEVLAGLSHC